MTMTRISRNDWNKVKAYEELTGAIVKVEGGRWIIDAPEEMDAYDTTADLMEFINYELTEARGQHITDGSFEEYRAICQAAGMEV